MVGVKGYIKDNIPRSWDIILRRNRCLGSFIEQFYQAIAKQKKQKSISLQSNNYECQTLHKVSQH